MKRVIFIILTVTALCANVLADDLYKVSINNEADAQALRAAGVEPILPVSNGYLVLADRHAAENMQKSGLAAEFMASGISTAELALDHRPDRQNVKKYELVFEEGDLRLYRVDPGLALSADYSDLTTIDNSRLRIKYRPPKEFYLNASFGEVDLDSLIGLVDQDSLTAYNLRLEAFFRRLTGTDSCFAARDWIKEKFESFGYDSVALDSFAGQQIPSYNYVPSFNVVAYKTGTRYPNRQVVIGGHYDAVPDCPGADDNGSGTAGVLEIARALKDIETEMTIIFIAFDSEESGLWGSKHYANAAGERGDSIIYMLNMDMIGYMYNDTLAKLFSGPVIAYSQLWGKLAKSLEGINITGVLIGGSAASDHYPFQLNGYDVTFVHEYIFNTNYHKSDDSSTYMNFDYMTRMIQASLATVYVVNQAPLPVTVTSVRDGGDGQSMQVNWIRTDPGRIDHYVVHYDAAQPYADTVSGDSSSHLVQGLFEGTQYAFYVIAVDTDGRSSVAFNKVYGRPQVRPAMPAGLSAMPLRQSIRLTWNANNTELDFDHYEIIRDGDLLLNNITDTAFIDDDVSLGSDFHDYFVVAVDNTGKMSDTTGVSPVTMKAAILQADKILAVNRSSTSRLAYVDEIETGVFMREALEGLDYKYYSDTVHSSWAESVKLFDMIDYGLMIIGAESARQDDIGNDPRFGGILDTIAYYLSIGGKVIIFGRWGDMWPEQRVDTVYFTPGSYDYAYTDWFNIGYRIIPASLLSGSAIHSDFIGAHSRSPEYPNLEWDSLATANHSLPKYPVSGIPCPSLPVLAGAKVDTLYTYNSSVDSTLTEGHPMAWRYRGDEYEYIFFEIPLSFMQRDSAVVVLRQAVSDMGISTSADDITETEPLPASFTLSQNYPNPFNPRTTIEFYNPESRPVKARLEVFNVLGQRVRLLFNGKALPGINRVEWDSRDGNNRSVATGIYFYRLKIDKMILTRKMVLLK